MFKKLLPLLFLFAGFQANAAIISIDATNSGWYVSGGTNNGTTSNIQSRVGYDSRNWLGFDLSSITDNIVAAVLEVASDPRNGSGLDFRWYDVSTSYADLGTLASVGIYDDLGTGIVYASGGFSSGTINQFALNSAGIASINGVADWAVGGRQFGTDVDSFGYTYGVSSGHHIKLVITTTVPEPSIVALIGLGLFGFGFARRRQS
jgi:hypothetical protein